MKLNEAIARQIVERTMKIIPYSVNGSSRCDRDDAGIPDEPSFTVRETS